MKIHHLPVDEALASLQSGLNRLSAAEAARRFAEYRPNEVEQVRREFLTRGFLRTFTHFAGTIDRVAP